MFLLALALATTPTAQVMGPGWRGQHLEVEGQVIALDGPCRQLAVTGQGIDGAAGRLWVCYDHVSPPDMGEHVRAAGTVTDTRMTRLGPRWRPVPLLWIHEEKQR